jgi:outer membrane protein assembly factor BamB
MRALTGLAFLACAPSALFAQAPDLSGWWRAEAERGNAESAIYLNLRRDGDRTRASFSIPSARMLDVAAGPYQADGATVRLPGVGWTLTVADGGRALEGILPEALVPYRRIPVRLERVAAPAPPPAIAPRGSPPAPAWRVSVGAGTWAGLVRDPRRPILFVAGGNGRLTALSTVDGRTAWSVDLGAPVHATPTLRDDRLYVATDKALLALNARDGSTVWTAPFGDPLVQRLPITDAHSEWDHYSSAAAVAGGLVLAGGRDGCVHALDRSSGQRRWRTCVGKMVTATPAIADGAVYFGAYDGRAYALSLADGSERWRHDTRGAIPRDAVVAGRKILFGSRSYDLVALDRKTGAPAWSRYFWYSWVDSPPVASGGTIFVGSSDALSVQALAADGGRRLWSAPLPGWAWAGPALGASSLYAGLVGTRSYIAPRDGGLAAIDRRTGTLRWLFQPEASGDAVTSGFASAAVVDGRRVYAADLGGNVYAIDD